MKSKCITDLDGVYSGSAVFSACVPSPQVTTSSLRFKKGRLFKDPGNQNTTTLPPDCWPWENLYIIIWFYHSLLVFIGQSCSFVLCLFFNFEMFNHPCVSVVGNQGGWDRWAWRPWWLTMAGRRSLRNGWLMCPESQLSKAISKWTKLQPVIAQTFGGDNSWFSDSRSELDGFSFFRKVCWKAPKVRQSE